MINVLSYLDVDMRSLILLTVLVAFFSACSSEKSMQDEYAGLAETRLYQNAEQSYLSEDYVKAANLYQALLMHYPLGKYTEQALLNMIYMHYREEDVEATYAACDQMLRLYPLSKHSAYALYMKAVVLLNYHGGWLQRKVHYPVSRMDVARLDEAFTILHTLLTRYSNSPYHKSARYFMWRIKDSLAEHELEVAQEYYKKSAYLASYNRAQQALSIDPRSSGRHASEAKKWMAASMERLKAVASSTT